MGKEDMSSVSARVQRALVTRVNTTRLPLSGQTSERLVNYLRSAGCAGLVELLCNVVHSSTSETSHQRERAELGDGFLEEFVRAAGTDSPELRAFAGDLWGVAKDATHLWAEGAHASDKIVIRAEGPEQPISQRLALAVDEARQRVALATGASIREAMAAAHERMVMPHSKADYGLAVVRIYVPRNVQLKVDGGDSPMPVHETELTARRFVIVGNPGAGKSTFIRYLVHRVATNDDRLVPMIVLLKQHQSLHEDFPSIIARELRPLVQREVSRQEICDLFDCGAGLVVFDGLDEVGDVQARRDAVTAIEAFAARFPLARVVVTCREESYPVARFHGENFPVYRLPDFDSEQVELYVRSWFELVPHHALTGEQRAAAFLLDSEHVLDLRSNPLMLSLLCMLYQSEGYIPENTADVYQECAELMLTRWDAVSHVPSVIRSSVKLAKILVQELANYFFFELGGKDAASERTLRQLVEKHLETRVDEETRTYRQQAQDFLDYCAERAWVLTQVDTTSTGERMFGFTHRTFMEYYTARYVLRTRETAEALVECLLPMITSGKSHVVPLVALQIYDMNREDGGDKCVRLFLDAAKHEQMGSSELAITTFCVTFLEHNNVHHTTVDATLEHAILLLGRSGSVELQAALVALVHRKKRADDALRKVLALTADRKEEFADIRLGAGLVVVEPDVAFEVVLGEVRHALVEPDGFVSLHRTRSLVYVSLSRDETNYVPGPLLRAMKDGLDVYLLQRMGELFLAAVTDVLPIPCSVLPNLLTHFPHLYPMAWSKGLFGVLAAAAFEAAVDWELPAEVLGELSSERAQFGEQLLNVCDGGVELRLLRDGLRQWADGKMSFVDFIR